MVSNVLHLTPQELVQKLDEFRREYADDPEYQEMRKPFPDDWPL